MSDLKKLSEQFKNNFSFLEQKYIVDFINNKREKSNNNKIQITLDLFYSLNEVDKNSFIYNDIENFKINSIKEYQKNFLIAQEFENLFSLLSKEDKNLLHAAIIFHKKDIIYEPNIQHLITLFDDKLYAQNQVYIIDNCLLKYFNEKHNIKSQINDSKQKEDKSTYLSEKDKKEIDNFYSTLNLMKQNQPSEYLYILGLILDKPIKHNPDNNSLKLFIEEYQNLDPNVKLQLKNKINKETPYIELYRLKENIENKNTEISLYNTIKNFNGQGFFSKFKIKNITNRIFNHLSTVDFQEIPVNIKGLTTVELLAYSKNNIIIQHLLKSGCSDFNNNESINILYKISIQNNNEYISNYLKNEFSEILFKHKVPTLNQLDNKIKTNNTDLKNTNISLKRK